MINFIICSCINGSNVNNVHAQTLQYLYYVTDTACVICTGVEITHLTICLADSIWMTENWFYL